MAGSTRVWLGGLVGFVVGIAVAEWRPRSALRDFEVSSASPTAQAMPIDPGFGSLSETPPSRARSVLAGSDPLPISLEARNRTMVYGQLFEEDGVPIRDLPWAHVVLVARTGHVWKTDASQGGYAFAGLPTGTYDVMVRSPAYRTAHETLVVSPDRPEVRKDILLSRAVTFRVLVVTPSGQPFFEAFRSLSKNWREMIAVQDIFPVATADPPGRRLLEVARSRNDPMGVGRFREHDPRTEVLPAACIGNLILQGTPPVFVSLVLGQVVLQSTQAVPGAQEVTFVLTPEEVHESLGSLQVQVLDATTSAPISGTYVTLRGGPPEGDAIQRLHHAETDSQGMARIDPALAGSFSAVIGGGHLESVTRRVEIEPGVLNDLGTVVLGAGATVELHVVDGHGNSMKASFFLEEISDGVRAIDFDSGRFVSSDPAGTLKLFGLGQRRYVLHSSDYEAWNASANAETTWVSENVLIDPTVSSARPLEVRLKPAVPLVIRVEGTPADKLGFLVVDAQALPLVHARFSGAGPRRLHLPAGPYRVQLCDAQWRVLAERPVRLDSEPVELAIGP